MSVTFWIPQAPQVRVEPYPEEEPGYMETRPAAPFIEMNLSNSNACAMLDLILPGADINGGAFEGELLHRVRRNVFKLLNINPEKFVEASVVEGNFYSGGRDMDYAHRRLTEMLVLLTLAIQHGFHVVYG